MDGSEGPNFGNAICVLGMHRSGTSCLIGSLQSAGLQLGDHSIRNPFNRHGNRENPGFAELHSDLLESNGGSWDEPPAEIRWRPEHEARARELIGSFPEGRPWGFKNPMALLALEGWKRLLPGARFIGIFRHPALVALSLNKRNNMPLGKGLRLWYHYNVLLLEELRRAPFPLLTFDWDEETFHAQINRLLPGLGLHPLAPDQRFFDSEIRHYDVAVDTSHILVPEESLALYRELQQFTVGEAAGDTAAVADGDGAAVRR